MMRVYIAVDIGGTQIRAGVFKGQDNVPIQIKRTSTIGNSTPLKKVIGLIENIWPETDEVNAIGIASPGPVDPFQGIVVAAPNIPGWTNIFLKDELQSHFNVPTVVGNDANFAALGEWKYGAGRGHHDLIYLTISTGIGGGIIVHDNLLLGCDGLAGEMGHITLNPDGPRCACGKDGHLESLSSGTAIARWVEEQIRNGHPTSLSDGETITCKDVALAASSGDELAKEAFERAGYFLGMGIANFVHIFNPSIVILGGGVMQSGDLIMKPVHNALEEFIIDQEYLKGFVLSRSSLGDESGLIGALTIIQNQYP